MPKTLYTEKRKGKYVKIYVDAGTRGNRICLVDGKKEIVKRRKGKLSNNELEYLAMIYGLEYAIHHYPKEDIRLYSDSKLVVYHLLGKWKVTKMHLAPLYVKASRLIKKHGSIQLIWTPRQFNLAGIVLEELLDK